jgi:Protein of unknown function (DUF998)
MDAIAGWVIRDRPRRRLLAGILTLLFGVGLRRTLRARRWRTTAAALVIVAGAAIAASAFPVDAAMIDTRPPNDLARWIHGIAVPGGAPVNPLARMRHL